MVDWIYISLSSIWILGASVLVAVFGIAVYDSSENKQSLRYLLSKRIYRLFTNLGLSLICAGLCGLAGLWWEKLFWALLWLGFLVNAGLARKDHK
jgi:hypothetical protein